MNDKVEQIKEKANELLGQASGSSEAAKAKATEAADAAKAKAAGLTGQAGGSTEAAKAKASEVTGKGDNG